MPAATGTISCVNCGTKYLWKPELAGKKVRCKCGGTVDVPELAPGAAAVISSEPAPASEAKVVSIAPAATTRTYIKPAPTTETDSLYDLAEDTSPPPAAKPAVTAPAARPMVSAPISIPGMEDDLYRCPSCNQGMAPGAIICEHCGFNLKTGEKVAVAGTGNGKPVRAAAKTHNGSSAFAGLPRNRNHQAAEPQRKPMFWLVPLVLVVVVVGGILGYKALAPSGPKTAAPTQKDDIEVARLTDENGATEIHEWYKQNPNRTAGEFNQRQALGKADELQQMGAKKVLAFGSLMTRSLAVELPDNPEQRKKIFAWENQFANDRHYPPAVDRGQKYIVLNLGL